MGAARLSLTFLVWDEPAVRLAVSILATGSSIGYWHEPENDPTRITPRVLAYRAVRLAQIAAEQGRVGQVRPAVVLMRWSVAPASQRDAMMARLMPPKGITAPRVASAGFIGWDSYAAGARTPDDMSGVPARWSAARSLPWAITETGIAQTPQSDPQVFQATWQAAFAFVTGTAVPPPPPQFLAWNQPSTDGGKWAVQEFPKSAAVWRHAPSSRQTGRRTSSAGSQP